MAPGTEGTEEALLRNSAALGMLQGEWGQEGPGAEEAPGEK